jgi:hypothetical protein
MFGFGRGTRCIVVVEVLYYKLEGRRFDSRWDHWLFFPVYLILPAALSRKVYLASNINVYKKK